MTREKISREVPYRKGNEGYRKRRHSKGAQITRGWRRARIALPHFRVSGRRLTLAVRPHSKCNVMSDTKTDQSCKVSEKSEASRIRDVLSILRDLVLIAAICLYFTGWLYIQTLYNIFGLSSLSLDIPIQYFFVYSYPVVAYASSKIIAALFSTSIFIVVLLAMLVIAIFVGFIFTPPYVKRISLILLMVIVLPAFLYLARKNAIELATETSKEIRRGRAPKIMFVLRKDAGRVYPREFIDANKNGNLRLLLHTKERYYAFSQPPGEALAVGCVYDISRNDILLSRIEMP
jgi:hypothetical protein